MKITFNTKEQLVTELEASRPLCKKADAERSAEHKKAEQEYLKVWRAALKAAASWSYVDAKRNNFRIPMPDSVNRPNCPESLVERLDRALFFANKTHQQKWTVDDNKYGGERDMYVVLTLDAPTVKSIC